VRYIVLCLLLLASSVQANDVCSIVSGAKFMAQDEEHTYLGEIANSYANDSIFNEYGTYGSEYNSSSIWNEYGTFGSEYSLYSPFNDYTSTPPMMIKGGKIIGYLSASKGIEGPCHPTYLRRFVRMSCENVTRQIHVDAKLRCAPVVAGDLQH
jgi:hypothetical protein